LQPVICRIGEAWRNLYKALLKVAQEALEPGRNVRLVDVDVMALSQARRRTAHEPNHGVFVHAGFGPARPAGVAPAVVLKWLNPGS